MRRGTSSSLYEDSVIERSSLRRDTARLDRAPPAAARGRCLEPPVAVVLGMIPKGGQGNIRSAAMM